MIMFEVAYNIFEYLPIRFQSELEEEYQWYLWGSFMALINDRISQASRFAVVPFHMLFMLAAEYKALRVSKAMPEQYRHAFTFRSSHRNHTSLLAPTSPYDFSNMHERSLFDLFRIVGADDVLIAKAKNLTDRRNELVHVNGAIEVDAEGNIKKYLNVLEELQKLFVPLNKAMAEEWIAGIDPEDDRAVFVESRLAASYLCPIDFEQGLLAEHFSRDTGDDKNFCGG